MNWTELLRLILDKGPTVGLIVVLLILVALLLRVIFDEDRTDLFRARAYRALLAITKKREHEKKYLSNDLRARLNLARRSIHYGRYAIPKAVKVEWFKGSASYTYDISDDEFVIRLDATAQQSTNIVRMASAVVRRTTLTGLSHVMSPSLRDALHLTLIRKLLFEVGSRPAFDEFFEKVYPQLGTNEEFDAWKAAVTDIDEQGLYERLLLVELEDFARRILGMEPRPYMLGSVENLVKFVHKLATRRETEKVRLEYLRAYIRVGVILVAKSSTILEKGLDPYLESARINIDQMHVEALYLIVWDKPHLRPIGDAFDYAKKCKRLRSQIRKTFSLVEHFSTPYNYIDPNGFRRTGEITRYYAGSDSS